MVFDINIDDFTCTVHLMAGEHMTNAQWPSHMQALTRIILGPQLSLQLADSDLWSKANTWPEDIFLLLSPLSCGWHLVPPPWCHAFPWPYLGCTLVEDPDTSLGVMPSETRLLSIWWLRPPPSDVHWSDCCVCELHMPNYRLWMMTYFTLTLILNWLHLTLWPWKSISFLDMCLTPHTWPFPCLYSLIITGPSFMVTSKDLFLLTCLTHLVMTLITVTMQKRKGPNAFKMVPQSSATGR